MMDLSQQISAIKRNLSSFSELSLHCNVCSINVHCNLIQDFEGLRNLENLKSLDASSNQIRHLDGLQHLISLRVLNLACNMIQEVKGLGNLVNLVSLNLSYNNIVTLQGFTEFHGAGYRLETLELHGNQISNMSDVILHLQGISSLRHLVLSHDATHDNPVCQEIDYRANTLSGLLQLTSLDYKDRNNRTVSPNADTVMEMLGLNLTLDEIESSSEPISNSMMFSSPERQTRSNLKTPNIDAVLSKVKIRPHIQSQDPNIGDALVESVISSLDCQRGSTTAADDSEVPVQDNQESRLKYLEEQLANLVAARQEKSKIIAADVQSSSETSPSAGRSKLPKQAVSKQTLVKRKPSTERKKTSKSSSMESRCKNKEDIHVGAQEKDTYLNLVKELENERERRWKSEQAARKLAQHVRDMSSEKAEGKSLQDMAAQTAERLKQALLREREQSDKLKSDVQNHKDKLSEMSEQVEEYRNTVEEQQSSLRALEATAAKADSGRVKMLSHQSKKIHESEMRASANAKELELQKSHNSQLRLRLSELQEILVGREQEHRKAQENMFAIDSTEFRSAVERETAKEEKRHHEDTRMLQRNIASLKTQYSELEDEFRQALHIEADRFGKTDGKYQQCAIELDRLQTSYRKVKEREEKSRCIVAELTSVAKEQKIKISELSKNKYEVVQQYKDQIMNLEIAAEEGRKKGVQLELIKQEKSRLVSQLAAVQSVVDGLRDERKLWGHELAQQGASLAQDRGRLESRIETMQQEMTSLRKQNERDLDALKIKSKIVDDQTETIHKMKQALTDKDNEIARIQEEGLSIQRKLEQDIEDLTQDNAALNEQIQVLLERKKELKSLLSESEKELDNVKQVHSKLVKKWAEKGQVLSQVESQVRQMKESFDKKEQKLAQERDEAVQAKRLVTERMERVDTAFREQLESSNSAHEEEMRRMLRNNENEMDAMKRKVLSVEEEMREVLRDAERQKKSMEAKLKRVTSAFKDLQEGFAD